MSRNKEYKIDDINHLINDFKSLDEKIRRTVATRSARTAMKVVVKAAKQNAQANDNPYTEEQIQKNVAAKFASRSARKYGDFVIRVGILGGAKSEQQHKMEAERKRNRRPGKKVKQYTYGPGGDTFYWRFLEHGTERSMAYPFLLKSLTQNSQQVLNVLTQTFEKELDKAIREQK